MLKEMLAESSLTKLSQEVTLWLKFSVDGDWTPMLTIPTEDISKYTVRPLKWLRFLGYAIYGHQGILLKTPAGPPIDDDTIGAESLQESYYYSSPKPPRLVDAEGVDENDWIIMASCPSDTHPPNDLTQWPPSTITDFMYACMAIQKWGSKGSIKMLQDLMHNLYYEDGNVPVTSHSESQEHEWQSQSEHVEAWIQNNQKRTTVNHWGEQEGDWKYERDIDWALWTMHANPHRTSQPHEAPESGNKKVQEWLQKQGCNS